MFIGTSVYDATTEPTYVGIITHPTAANNDNFGHSVAVGNGRIVVGCPFDNIGTGLGLGAAGSAHIYDLNGNYVGIITHPTAAYYDQFGYSVAVGSGRIVVGAILDDIGGLTEAGSALIYDLNGNYVGILTHPNAVAYDYFGYSVAVGNGRIVVGGINSTLIYDLNGNYVGIITHTNVMSESFDGNYVSVGSGRIVVGARNDNVGGLSKAGSALIYDLNGNYVGIITHPNAAANDYFGNSVAVGNGRIVVGALYDDIGGLSNAGSAHIYDLKGNYVGIITHPNAAANDYFGNSVAVGNGRIVVGAILDDIGGLSNAGSVHIYDLNGNYVGIITHPNAAANDYFGNSVAVGNGRIVVGARYDDIGIGLTAGSAHIFSTPKVNHILDLLD
jgi:hypothetical protein